MPNAGPPLARRVDTTDDYFGTKLTDPYRWMEKGGDELRAYLTAEGAYTSARLAALPGRTALVTRVRELSNGATSVGLGTVAGGYRYYRRTDPGDEIGKLAMTGPDGKERILIDPTKLKGSRGHVSVDSFVPSMDGKLVAVNLAEGGGEITRIHIYEGDSGKERPDVVDRIWGQFGVSWFPDGKRFFYTQMAEGGADPLQGMRLMLHTLGRPATEDTLVLGPGKDQPFPLEPKEFPRVWMQAGCDWMVATAGGARSETRLAVARLSQLRGEKTPWRAVAAYQDGVTSFGIVGNDLYLLMEGASTPNRRVVRVPLTRPDLSKAKVLVAEDPAASIEDMAVAKDGIYLVDLLDGRARFRRLSRDGSLTTIALPHDGWVPDMAADPGVEGVYLALHTWTRPAEIHRYQPRGGFSAVDHDTSVADYSGIETREVNVPADDGQNVPLTILVPRDAARDGSHPTLLNAYGGYGSPITPYYAPGILAWLERGGVVAYCHVRGGGEKGKAWHLAGKGPNKPRGVKDFQACAQYLVAEKYTTVPRLSATGGSMGGVLIGRAITERPELFGAAVISVGMVNVLRYLEGQNGANQTAELEGVPTTPEGFRTLLAMDAYQNVKPGVSYPATMFVVGLNDGRVPPWNSAKMAARMQALAGTRPILVRVDADEGHGIGSTRDQSATRWADVWAFMLWQSGDPDFQP